MNQEFVKKGKQVTFINRLLGLFRYSQRGPVNNILKSFLVTPMMFSLVFSSFIPLWSAQAAEVDVSSTSVVELATPPLPPIPVNITDTDGTITTQTATSTRTLMSASTNPSTVVLASQADNSSDTGFIANDYSYTTPPYTNYQLQTLGKGFSGSLSSITLMLDQDVSSSVGFRLEFIGCSNTSPCIHTSSNSTVVSNTGLAPYTFSFNQNIALDTNTTYSFYLEKNNFLFDGNKVKIAGSTNSSSYPTGYCNNFNSTTQYFSSYTFSPCANGITDMYFILNGSLDSSCTGDCFPNVLFLPGIKGSVLKMGSSDTIWPPTVFDFGNDVRQLALTDEGESVNDVFTDGIINTFLTQSIYGPYSEFMDSLTGEEGKLINEWLPLAYDWRFSPEKIIEDGIKTAEGTIDVIQRIEELAANSRTGQVAIVSHSMGGLLGKAIIKKLEEDGKDNLIDSFVMVGTPQLGTPQAIAAILHGDGEGIVGGLIVDASDIREVAQNMPSAYNLLPSPRYFEEVSDPAIKFDSSSSFTQPWRDFWGETLDTYFDFLQFTTGQGVVRTNSDLNILRIPKVLRTDLVIKANDFHDEYDNYQLPEHIRVVQVAGWGRPTTKAINYKTQHFFQNYGYETVPTVEGDVTVVYPSAVSSVVDETYFFDLAVYNALEDVPDSQHRDLLSTSPIQNLLKNVIEGEDVLETSFIRITKPNPGSVADQLVLSTHSPVILGAYDQLGNFTGINPNQDLSAEVLLITEDIPGSTFLYTSESQQIFLPKEGSYDFIYKGTGSGPTTVEIENFSVDVVTPVVAYTDIPTTTDTVANFIVQSATPESTVISLDANGDGATDQTIFPDGTEPGEPSLGQLLTLLKEKVQALTAKDKLKQNLLKKIDNIEKKIIKKKENNAKILQKFGLKINKQEMKGKISSSDASSVLDLVALLEAQSDITALDFGVITDLKTKIQSLNIKPNVKNDLLKRIERLENKNRLISTLSNLSMNIVKKGAKGKIEDGEAQILLDILTQIEGVI